MFGLSDYEVAWSNIAQYQRDYETEKKVYEKDPDVIGLEKLSNEYNRASEDFTLLELDLETSTQRLAVAKRLFEEADLRLKRMEEKKLAVEELRRREAKLNANVANTSKTLAKSARDIEDKKTLLDGMLKRQISFESQIKQCLLKLEQAGLPANQSIDDLGPLLAGFDEKITSMRAEQEATTRSMQQDQKRAVSLTEESKCPLCGQPLTGEYKTDLLQRITLENAEREKTINQLRLEVATLQKTKTAASEAVSGLQT